MSIRRLLITTDVVGGVWDFSLLLGRELHARHGVDVTLLALGEPGTSQAKAAAAGELELCWVPVRLEWMNGAEDDVTRSAHAVERVARRVGADIVHANQFASAMAQVQVPTVLTIHSDVLSWQRWVYGQVADADFARWGPYRALVRAALQRADAVAAVSGFLAREVTDLYAVQRPIEVVHNGWPAASVEHETRRGTLLAGRVWDAAKRIPFAVEAANGWHSDPILVAGEVRHPESGAGVDLGPHVQCLGFLPFEQLAAYLERVAVYLSAARYDPFGLLPLQAALHGCALLLSDIPSYRELWSGAAFFFQTDDTDDLRRRWQMLLADDALRRDLQQKASARARTVYTPSAMADTYLDLYARAQAAIAA